MLPTPLTSDFIMGLIGEEAPILDVDRVEYTLHIVLRTGIELDYTISISKTDEERRLREYSAYIKGMVQNRLRGLVIATASGSLVFVNGDDVAVLELK